MNHTFLFCLSLIGFLPGMGQLRAGRLQIGDANDPVGVPTNAVRFSWTVYSKTNNCSQAQYELEIYTREPMRRKFWASGKVRSTQSYLVEYTGAALSPLTKYYWRVRIGDQSGHLSTWSSWASFVTALGDKAPWHASWISSIDSPGAWRPCPLFRKPFYVKTSLRSALLCMTAQGLYDCRINDAPVTEAIFSPGWTSYSKRLQYQVHDVTPLVTRGANLIGVTLGNGWYRGYVGSNNTRDFYGKDLALLATLRLEYPDGSVEWVGTDSSWKTNFGAIQSAEFFDGDSIDFRRNPVGWTRTGYDDHSWHAAKIVDIPFAGLVAGEAGPVKQRQILEPVKLITTPKGETVLDFGQNFAGWVQLRLAGHEGQLIRVAYGEVLDKAGNFYMENMRLAKPVDRYILSGGAQDLQPYFTYHGFRYARIEGLLPGQDWQARAVVISSVPSWSGHFECSDSLINRLQQNIQWSQLSNFIDIPTDCPQRDERLGWTGDAQVFASTALFNSCLRSFYIKWLRDLYADQLPGGAVPYFIPNLGRKGCSSGWGDAVTIVPWQLFLSYGDTAVLREAYPAMKGWVNYMDTHSRGHLWDSGFHFGDWLYFRPEDDDFGNAAITDKYLIAQCFFAHSCDLTARAARIIGDGAGAENYTALAGKVRAAFRREYLSPAGRLSSNTQTAYALAIVFNMIPDSLRPATADRLARNIKEYKYHITTGFLGTPYLCEALYTSGLTYLADSLLMQKTYPSWLYPLTRGATTIWERWDGIKPDSSFQWSYRNSFNHYAYGAVGNYLYSRIGGISCLEDGAGYRHSLIRPYTVGVIRSASTSLETPYGLLSVSWRRILTDSLEMDFTIPPGTRSRVELPGIKDVAAVYINGKSLSSSGIPFQWERGCLVFEEGSGTYQLRVH